MDHQSLISNLHIEEVLKALVTLGAIFYSNGQWERKPIGELNIPPTIQTAMRQRVELLSLSLRRVLVLAAVASVYIAQRDLARAEQLLAASLPPAHQWTRRGNG